MILQTGLELTGPLLTTSPPSSPDLGEWDCAWQKIVFETDDA